MRQVSTLRLLNVRQKLFMMFNKKHKHRIGLSEIDTEVDEDKLNSVLYYLTFEPSSKIPKGLSNVKTVNSHVVKNYYNYFAKRGSKMTLQDIEKIMYCVHESIMKEVIEKEKVYVMPMILCVAILLINIFQRSSLPIRGLLVFLTFNEFFNFFY